jgi:hypothetical protein
MLSEHFQAHTTLALMLGKQDAFIALPTAASIARNTSSLRSLLTVVSLPSCLPVVTTHTVCSGQFDTPLHTATLLSMLKMAQQLAAAEAELQEQEQQLVSRSQQASALQDRDQDKSCPQLQRLQLQETQLIQTACSAAAVLVPPGLALLQLCRDQCGQVTGLPASHQPLQGLWVQGCEPTQQWFSQRFGLLLTLAVQQDSSRLDMLGSQVTQVSASLLSCSFPGYAMRGCAGNTHVPYLSGSCQQCWMLQSREPHHAFDTEVKGDCQFHRSCSRIHAC